MTAIRALIVTALTTIMMRIFIMKMCIRDRNISELMDIRPDYANIEVDGKLTQVDPDEVAIGSVIVVQPGEKVPIDGVIVEGSSTLNTSALTGESVPRDAKCGDEIISGCINMSGVLKIKTTKRCV